MMNRGVPDGGYNRSRRTLLKTIECKEWSGPILTRVFNRTGVPGFELGSLGSAKIQR